MEKTYIENLRSTWNTLADDDPLWAVLSDPTKTGGRWDPAEFFASGVAHIDQLLNELAAAGLGESWGHALDFGCGVGRLTQALARRADRATGIDISAGMIALANEFNAHGDRCRYIENHQPDLRVVETATVDLVVTFIVLQHMAPELALGYLAEFGRVLRPGGVLVCQLPGYPVGHPVARGGHRARIGVTGAPTTMAPGATATLTVDVRNDSPVAWQPGASCQLRAGNHWIGRGRRAPAINDDGRADVPDLGPGESAQVALQVTAPASPGTFELQVDVVEEGVAWFAGHGSPVWSTVVEVVADAAASSGSGAGDEPSVIPPPTTVFEMHAVRPSTVVSAMERADLRIVRVEPNEGSGPAWHSYQYVAVKHPGLGSDGRP